MDFEREKICELEEKTRQNLMKEGWELLDGNRFAEYLTKMALYRDETGKADFVFGRVFCAPDGLGGYYIRS